MKKIAVIIANGSEEIEAITPIDVIRRTGAVCDVVSVNGLRVKGSHGIEIKADRTAEGFDVDGYDGIVIPGGMPGATNIAGSTEIIKALKTALSIGKVVGAICASPAVVLASNGLIDGKKATCYPAPAFIDAMNSAVYTANDVEVDGNLVTANGPKSALKFALAFCELLKLTPQF